jgi:hypothetical protein
MAWPFVKSLAEVHQGTVKGLGSTCVAPGATLMPSPGAPTLAPTTQWLRILRM